MKNKKMTKFSENERKGRNYKQEKSNMTFKARS